LSCSDSRAAKGRLGALDQPIKPGSVTVFRRAQLTRITELLQAKLTDRFQQPESRFNTARVSKEERLVNQPTQQVENILLVNSVVRTDGFGCVQACATGKDR